MFGGVCFMVDGSMCCGVSHNALMVRVGSAARDAALRKPHTRPMMMRGKPLSAFILVDPEGCRTDAALARWVRQAVEFVSTLSEKEASPKPKRTPRRVRG
jgi:TfoX/Sxy family transcriptional regulator of competence genes